jgi:hypothetical protein
LIKAFDLNVESIAFMKKLVNDDGFYHFFVYVDVRHEQGGEEKNPLAAPKNCG